MLTAIATILTVQVAQAGSLLTGTSGSSGSLLNSSGNTTGGSLMNGSYAVKYTTAQAIKCLAT